MSNVSLITNVPYIGCRMIPFITHHFIQQPLLSVHVTTRILAKNLFIAILSQGMDGETPQGQRQTRSTIFRWILFSVSCSFSLYPSPLGDYSLSYQILRHGIHSKHINTAYLWFQMKSIWMPVYPIGNHLRTYSLDRNPKKCSNVTISDTSHTTNANHIYQHNELERMLPRRTWNLDLGLPRLTLPCWNHP